MNENKPGREKYWSEMDDRKRINTLLNELARTQHALKSLSDYVTNLISHDHKDGKLITVINHPNSVTYDGFNFRVYDAR